MQRGTEAKPWKSTLVYLLMTSGESGVSLVMSRLVKSCLDKCGWPEVTVGRAFDSVLTSSWTVMVLENR